MVMAEVFLPAFLLGAVCGLRSMTGPAVVCWGAQLGWLRLEGSPFGFLHHRASLILFTVFALGELVADKLPFIPSRTQVGPLIVRIISGALCGGALGVGAGAAWMGPALLGAVGGVAGTFAGYHARHALVTRANLPDLPVALLEDLVAVGGGFLLVSRF